MKIKIGPYRKNRAYHIHIDDYDVWSLDHTLASIIHPALVRLKDTKHGYPELWEDGMVTHHNWDRQLHFDFIDEEVETKYLVDKWNRIMEKMIYSLNYQKTLLHFVRKLLQSLKFQFCLIQH